MPDSASHLRNPGLTPSEATVQAYSGFTIHSADASKPHHNVPPDNLSCPQQPLKAEGETIGKGRGPPITAIQSYPRVTRDPVWRASIWRKSLRQMVSPTGTTWNPLIAQLTAFETLKNAHF